MFFLQATETTYNMLKERSLIKPIPNGEVKQICFCLGSGGSKRKLWNAGTADTFKPRPFLRQRLFSLYFFVSCVVRLYYFVHQLPPWCIFTGKCIRLVSVFICFSVFGTHDEAQSLSFLDVFSNETIRSYAMAWFLRYCTVSMCCVNQ